MEQLTTAFIAFIVALLTWLSTYFANRIKHKEQDDKIDSLYEAIDEVKKSNYKAYILCVKCNEKNILNDAKIKFEKGSK